jgi:hypothetical protein
MADTLDLKSNPIKGIGSSPMLGTHFALLAQLVEHLIPNQKVIGSIPIQSKMGL